MRLWQVAGLALLLLAGLAGCDLFREEQTVEVVWAISKRIHLAEPVQPVVEGGVAYVAYDSRIQVLDAASGRVRWTRELDLGGRRFASRKLLHDDGRLFINQAGWVMAFAKANGSMLWSVVIPDFAPRGREKPAQDDEFVYVAGHGVVQQVRKADGALGHRFEVGAFAAEGAVERAGDVAVTPDGVLVVPTRWHVAGDSIAIRGAVYGFDSATGQERWRFATPLWRWNAPSGNSFWAWVGATGADAGDGRVYVTTDTQVLGVDPATGTILWERPMHEEDGGGFWVGPTAANGAVFVGGIAQYAHKFDRATGEVVWSRLTDGSMQPTMTVRDGRVYFTNNGWGELWVLDERTGEPVWHSQPPDHKETNEYYFSPPGVGEDRIVVVGGQFVYGLSKP